MCFKQVLALFPHHWHGKTTASHGTKALSEHLNIIYVYTCIYHICLDICNFYLFFSFVHTYTTSGEKVWFYSHRSDITFSKGVINTENMEFTGNKSMVDCSLGKKKRDYTNYIHKFGDMPKDLKILNHLFSTNLQQGTIGWPGHKLIQNWAVQCLNNRRFSPWIFHKVPKRRQGVWWVWVGIPREIHVRLWNYPPT